MRDKRNKFIRHLERASKIVASWPPWKQSVLDNDPRPFVELQQLYVDLDAIDHAIDRCMFRDGVMILRRARARVLGEIKELERKRA
jgi:hypothetical protein